MVGWVQPIWGHYHKRKQRLHNKNLELEDFQANNYANRSSRSCIFRLIQSRWALNNKWRRRQHDPTLELKHLQIDKYDAKRQFFCAFCVIQLRREENSEWQCWWSSRSMGSYHVLKDCYIGGYFYEK